MLQRYQPKAKPHRVANRDGVVSVPSAKPEMLSFIMNSIFTKDEWSECVRNGRHVMKS